MKLHQQPDSDFERQANNAVSISLVTALIMLLAAISVSILGEMRILPLAVLALLASIISYQLARNGKHILGSWLMIGIFSLAGVAGQLLQKGQGIYLGIIVLSIIGSIAFISLPRRFAGPALMLGTIIALSMVAIDQFGSASRPASQVPQAINIVFSIVTFSVLGFFVLREFASLDLRTKIATGVLATGGIALIVLSLFALERAGRITSSLSERLEISVSQLAEEQLTNVAYKESETANQFFLSLMTKVNSLADYRVALQDQADTLEQGNYWNAVSNLIELDGGHYGNSAQDVSSVFIPVNTNLDENLLAELNVSAYLDFVVPQALNENSAILAVYYINPKGVTRYYPNIELATLLPPDFDATSRPYYVITAPVFNQQRLARWTIPYVDAAGGGLVVTVAAPVYYGENFNGVVAADIQLSAITEQVSAVTLGQTGYAFMIDDAGRIISMPPEGYEMFGVNPNDLPAEEYFKQSLLGAGSDELRSITNRMVAGGRGLGIVNVNGVDTYISYAPVKTNGYSLALVVPVSEMQGAIASARTETQAQLQSATQSALFILLILFIGAITASLALGQVIAAPVRRLTEIAGQVSRGDLSVQATSNTRDEIGMLAEAFNSMTSRLRDTLEGLEQKVAERTTELSIANERNERRAKQFESIANVARTISSTRDLDSLLTQITATISHEFGFYHTGIFLVDTAREFAVLSAANSEGGQIMLARGHRLKIGEAGMVGYVTATGKPRVALDTGKDAVFFNNPDLPETRSEITLPLQFGGEIIGALDVQSTAPNAFTQEDINILSTLADQVSIAIQNARQFEETRLSLAESEALSRQFVQTGWARFTQARKLEGIRHTGAKSTLLYKKSGADKGRSGTSQLTPRGRGAVLSLPVKLRGEVIGTVDIRSPENRQWDQDELDIVTAIIERSAIAMENARLLTESQKLAAKERTIGEISAKVSAQSGVEELLKTAALELGRALPRMEIAIQINKDQETRNA